MEELTQTTIQAPQLKYVVDTSRPFRSVKEAVAIFGERFLAGEVYAASPSAPSLPVGGSPMKFSPGSMKTREPTVFESLKKLEAELEETKLELQLLKERESGTETALASLNAELRRNVTKLENGGSSGGYGGRKKTKTRTERSPTLAQILRTGEMGGKREKKMEKKKKKKPIIPLVTDVIAMVKRSSSSQVCK